jgi:Trk-type K+ transport systems, membrane components
VFMLLFSLNFNLYYLILIGHAKEALKSEEMHTFLGIVLAAVIFVSISIRNMYSGIGEALRHAFFNVSTLISTTGFGTVDFDTWPEYAKWVLLGIMLIGGCAGSTAGGLKVSRIIILVKSAFADVKQMVHPRSVNIVRLDGRRVNEETVKVTQTYFAFYMTVIIISAMLVSFDTPGIVSSFSASIACISNVGPGLEKVGPTTNYAFLSDFSKIVLSIEMLMGRLEIYPILMLFYPQMWKGEKVARGKKH